MAELPNLPPKDAPVEFQAQQLVRRKLAGGRIDVGLRSDAVRRRYDELIRVPSTRRELGRTAGSQISARERGFRNVQEEQQFSGFVRPERSDTAQPTEREIQERQSLPEGEREKPVQKGPIGSGARGGFLFSDPTARGGAREFFPAEETPEGTLFTSVPPSEQSPGQFSNQSREGIAETDAGIFAQSGKNELDQFTQVALRDSSQINSLNYLTDVEARRELPVGERLKIAFESAGEGSEVYGGLRVGFELTDIALTPIYKATGFSGGPAVSTRFAEQTALFVGVLGPVSPTTSQLNRQLFSTSRVNVGGVSQQASSKTLKTDFFFSVERAGTILKGTGRAESLVIGQGDDIARVVTGLRGQQVSRGIKFPSVAETIKKSGRFQGVEVGEVKTLEKVFVSRSLGQTRQRGFDNFFTSRGIGQRRGNSIIQFALTQTERGPVISRGFFKLKEGGSKFSTKITESGTKRSFRQEISETLIQEGALGNIQSIVSKSIQIKPKTTVNILPPITSTQKALSKEVTIQTPTSSIIQVEKTKQKQTPLSKQSDLSLSASKQKFSQPQLQKTRQKESQLEKQLVKTKQITLQRQNNRLLSSLKTRQLQRQQQKRGFFNLNITPNPTTPKEKFFPFRLGKGKEEKKKKGSFNVLVKRFGEFKVVGKSSTQSEAVNLGKSIVGSTLARSFKIKGPTSPKKIEGFRTKQTKGGPVFIEPSKRALSAGSEKKEIQLFKALSPKKKKGKNPFRF